MANTTLLLETNCPSFHWHITILPSNFAKRCWAMQANIGTLCNAKVKNGKNGMPAPTYKGLKKEYHSTNNMKYKFWFCPDGIKRCVSGNTKEYVLDWHVVPNMWLAKIGTNLSRQEVLALEDDGFQLQQRETLSPRHRFSTITMLSIPWTDFHVPLNPDAHPTSRFGRLVRGNLATSKVDHRNKWESAGLMDGYYMVGITVILYP